MTKRSDAHRAADARYEPKRKTTAVLVRVPNELIPALDAKRHPNESRPAVLLRLAGLTPGIQHNDGSINDE